MKRPPMFCTQTALICAAFMLVAIITIAGLQHASASAPPQPIGTAEILGGTATISRADMPEGKPAQKLMSGSYVFKGDRIFTTDNSVTHIGFVDGTEITLVDEGEFHINEYIYIAEQPEISRARYTLLRAGFEYIGGLIDKEDDPKVRLDLDFGSVGIRGTKIWRAMKDKTCWIYLAEGSALVFNNGGNVELEAGEGTTMSDRTIGPSSPAQWDETDIQWLKNAVKAR